MSEDRPQPGIPGRPGSGAPGSRERGRRGSAGEPNVISGVATPNRLSTESAAPTGALSGTRQVTPGDTRPVGATPARRRIPIPSLPTLIFLGFVAITAFRIFGEVADQLLPTAPGTTSPAAGPASVPTAPGAILFGTGSDEDCGVTGEGVRFQPGTDVYWSAMLSEEQAADAGAVVIVRRDDQEVEREEVPPDESFGVWDQLCSGAPVAHDGSGSYRVEVWDEDVAVMLAAGTYTLSTSP